MESIYRFLAHAARLEAAAVRRFDELAEIMRTHGNARAELVFRQMSDYSRQHLLDVRECGAFQHCADPPDCDYEWPDGEPPECASWWGVDGLLDADGALALALESERRGLRFYADVAASTRNIKVMVMADKFAEEEAGHVGELERLLQQHMERAQP